jgi:eukaryotic-like serine/threonine-protein kinase
LVIKPLLSAPIVFILLIVSVSLTISIFNALPHHHQQAMAQKTTTTAASITKPLNVKTTTSKFLTYQNSTYGIKIQYPSDWLYKESNAGTRSVQTIVTFASPDSVIAPINSTNSLVALTVAVQSLPFHNLSLNAYTNLNVDNLRQAEPGFHLLASNDTTLAGGPAHKITYTFANGVKTMAVYTIKENKAFILEYITGSEATYPSYLPIAQKMIDSFQIIK